VIVTHGYEAVMVRWLREQGLDACAFETEFTGEEGASAGDDPADARMHEVRDSLAGHRCEPDRRGRPRARRIDRTWIGLRTNRAIASRCKVCRALRRAGRATSTTQA
jgi:hypothetical protein